MRFIDLWNIQGADFCPSPMLDIEMPNQLLRYETPALIVWVAPSGGEPKRRPPKYLMIRLMYRRTLGSVSKYLSVLSGIIRRLK